MRIDDGLSQARRRRFTRNILLDGVGETGQLKLCESRVLVIGLGGLGSPALLYLAAAGVGTIGVVDSDVVELSNLQRQILHGDTTLGLPKTESACRRIERLDPAIRLVPVTERLTPENAPAVIGDYDFIIEATDNFPAKFMISDCCVAAGKPYSHGGILGMIGQSLTYVPGRGPCFRCVFEAEPEPGSVKTTDEVGVLGSVAGVIGCIQATEAVKYLVGIGELLTSRVLTFDGLSMHFREVRLNEEPRCPVCRKDTA